MVTTKLRHHCWLFWSACVGIFFLAICRYWIPYVPSDSVPNNIESFRLALNLAHSGRFADPYLIPSGPSAHIAPAFPFLLSLLVRIFGDGSAGIYAIKLSAIFVLSLQLALFPVFAETLGMNASAGFIAAFLWIAAKVGLMVERDHPLAPVFNWESLYAALLVSVLLYGCRRWMDDAEDDRVAISWLIGVTAGLLVMTSPTSVIIFGGWFIWMAYRERHHHFGRTFAVIALIPFLLTLAWLLRNYLVFDRPVFVRDNFGLELSVANNDCAMFGMAQSYDSGCYQKVHPNVSLNEAREVAIYGEPGYNERKFKLAKVWIAHNPGRFLKLVSLRFLAFWMPPANGQAYSMFGSGRRLERTAVQIMTVLSVPGLLMLFRKDRQSAIVCMVCLALFPLVYYIVDYEYRYRYPILWLTFLLGSLPLEKAVERLRSARSQNRNAAKERNLQTRTGLTLPVCDQNNTGSALD